MSSTTTPLHQIHRQPLSETIFHRTHILLHSILILLFLYYRTTHLHNIPLLAWTLIFTSELTFTFLWTLSQPFRWRRLSRSVTSAPLPAGKTLPPIDVFICTADSKKEPTIEVMNTVISVMAMDYPPEKLAVYLSDDGGSVATLHALKEAEKFAKWWVPFCRKYSIKTVCPEAYFSGFADDVRGDEFKVEEQSIKSKYEQFKQTVVSGGGGSVNNQDSNNISGSGRAPVVEVIHDGTENENKNGQIPLLVYVSREKRPSYPHRGKAGAVNTLLRVSGIISNSPYILVLDCDMYCNDPTSARRAMCFHLDPHISPSLAFVQYPQIFYTGTDNDIYGSQVKYAYLTLWRGMDGLRGPGLAGTGFYMKRVALFKTPKGEDTLLRQSKENFGFSTMFIASLEDKSKQNERNAVNDELLKEAHFLATCTFEKGTKWGSEIGFSYDNYLESTFTGYLLHCKGWKSAYYYPKRPAFMGCASVDMKGAVVQLRKWNANLLDHALSKFSPIIYATSRMSILQSMCYGYFAFQPLFSFAYLVYGLVPQLCFYKGISLYPKATNPWFAVFALLWASSRLHYLYEFLSSGMTLRAWWSFERMAILQSLTASLFGCLDAFMKKVGIQLSISGTTDKVIDDEKLEKYKKGKFDFQGAEIFMVPVVILVLTNIVCFVVGVKNVIVKGGLDEMFGQFFLTSLVIVLSFSLVVR